MPVPPLGRHRHSVILALECSYDLLILVWDDLCLEPVWRYKLILFVDLSWIDIR